MWSCPYALPSPSQGPCASTGNATIVAATTIRRTNPITTMDRLAMQPPFARRFATTKSTGLAYLTAGRPDAEDLDLDVEDADEADHDEVPGHDVVEEPGHYQDQDP